MSQSEQGLRSCIGCHTIFHKLSFRKVIRPLPKTPLKKQKKFVEELYEWFLWDCLVWALLYVEISCRSTSNAVRPPYENDDCSCMHYYGFLSNWKNRFRSFWICMKLVKVHRYSQGARGQSSPILLRTVFSNLHMSQSWELFIVMPTAPTVVHNADSGHSLMMSTVAAARVVGLLSSPLVSGRCLWLLVSPTAPTVVRDPDYLWSANASAWYG
jgi:hypothetical protein